MGCSRLFGGSTHPKTLKQAEKNGDADDTGDTLSLAIVQLTHQHHHRRHHQQTKNKKIEKRMLDSICHTKSWKDYTGQHRQRGWGAASWNFWEERGWEMEAGVCLPEDDLAIGN